MFLADAQELRAYIRRRVGDAAEAEEVFQDLSLVVIRHCANSTSAEQFSAWYRALTRHLVARHFRNLRRRADLLNRVEFESAGYERSERVDPERSASARELLNRLGRRLDPQAKELLWQRYLLGENAGEIGRRLKQSPTAVRMRLMRLRTMVKRSSA